MKLPRWKKQGLLTRAGLTHVAGWVRSKDAKVCQDAIQDAKPDVDKVLKNEEGSAGEI